MFFLRAFPTAEMIARMRQDFPDLEPDAMQVCIRLLVMGSELLTSLDKMLEPYGLSHGRWVALMLLRRRPVWHALPSELAEEQGVTRATMSGLLCKLEKQGLVRRQPDPEDGRRSVIVLTEEGAVLVDEAFPRCYRLAAGAVSQLNPEEKQSLLALLGKVRTIVE